MSHPMRMCVSCKVRKMQDLFIRLQLLPSSLVGPVVKSSLPGRSAYVCPNQDCVKQATQRGTILRSLFRGQKTHARIDEPHLWAVLAQFEQPIFAGGGH